MNRKLDLVVKRPYDENDSTLCFKTTPIIKVIILSILTFGFYNLILFYNYWKSLNERFGHQVSPFWRAFFAWITNFSLFPILSNYASAFKTNIYAPILLAII